MEAREIKISYLRKAAKADNQYPLRIVDGVRWHMRQDMPTDTIHNCFCIFIDDGLNQCGKLVTFGAIPSEILFGNGKHFYVVQAMPVFRACSRSGR